MEKLNRRQSFSVRFELFLKLHNKSPKLFDISEQINYALY